MKTNYQSPGTSEIRSTQIDGIQETLGKIEDILDMQLQAETGIALSEVYISTQDRYRIYQAPAGKRNWASSPGPVIKKNGTIISEGFTIDHAGGAIIVSPSAISTDVFTADASYTKVVGNKLETHLAETAQQSDKNPHGIRLEFTDRGENIEWFRDNGDSDDIMFNKAIDYCNANGGRKIIIPRPYQIEHTLHPILSSNVFFEGLGGELSKITFISDTEDLFTVGINDGGSQIVRRIEFEKIYFSHNSTKTAGVTIKCLQSQKVLLKDILYGNAFTFVQLGYDGDGVSNFVVIDNAIGTHVGNSKCVDIQGCSGIHLIKVQANNEYNGTAIKFPTTGSMDTLFIDNCLFQRFNYGLTALCSAGVTQNVFANALVIDGCALNAMLIKPTGTGIVTRFHFDTSWFYSRDNEGIVISKGASDGETDGIHFDTCRVLKSGKTGVDIQRGKNISFSGKSIISGNSHLGSGLYDGVNIGSATENVSIVGATIGNEGQMINNQRYGINVAPGANNYMITNNILRGNVTSGLYEPTPGANRVVTNNLV